MKIDREHRPAPGTCERTSTSTQTSSGRGHRTAGPGKSVPENSPSVCVCVRGEGRKTQNLSVCLSVFGQVFFLFCNLRCCPWINEKTASRVFGLPSVLRCGHQPRKSEGERILSETSFHSSFSVGRKNGTTVSRRGGVVRRRVFFGNLSLSIHRR